MNTEFVDILKKLIAEQGKEALLNPVKCKAFLADYTHGDYKKENRLLLQSLDAGVQKAIDTTDELEICKKQQTRVLQEEYFLASETAADVVETLALVLREDKQKEKQKPTLCANCGKELQKEWKACPYCLTPLAKTQQEQPKLELLADYELDNIFTKSQLSSTHVAQTPPSIPTTPPEEEGCLKVLLKFFGAVFVIITILIGLIFIISLIVE
jgi:uncharacterized protein with PIN domain